MQKKVRFLQLQNDTASFEAKPLTEGLAIHGDDNDASVI